jgi:hypothetical protein
MANDNSGASQELLKAQAKILTALSASIIELRANSDAVITLLARYAPRLGVSSEQLVSELHQLYRVCHEKRLEQAEDIDPWAAALIDRRKIEGLGDLESS